MNKPKPINNNWIQKAFWFLFFLIFPMISFPFLPDHDFEPKYFFISLCLLPLIWQSWIRLDNFKSASIVRLLFLCISVFIIYTGIRSLDAINDSEGLSSWISLAIPFIFLFLLITSDIISLKYVFEFVPYTVFLLGSILLYQVIENIIQNGSLQIDNYLSSTLSNKNFLSESLLLLFTMTLSGIIYCKKGHLIRNIIAAVLILVIILLLHTISVWISLFINALIFIPIYFSLIKNKPSPKLNFFSKKMVIVYVVAPVLILSILAGLNKIHAFDSLKNKIALSWNYLNSDMSVITEKENENNVNSVFERIFLWRSSIKLGKENPLTGIGLSNWKIMWPKYGVGGAYFLSSGVMHYEHPHNEFLLLFSETGIIGLSLFLLIFITILLLAIKFFRNAETIENKKIILILSAGVFSFLIISFFEYPAHRPFSIILLMLLISLIIHIGSKNTSGNKTVFTKSVIVICLLLTLLNLRISAMRLKGEYYMQRALNEQSKGRFARMLTQINLADNKYYRLDGTCTPLDWYRGFAFHYSGSDSALYYFKKAEIQNPYHIQILSDIGATLENSGNHQEAITYLRRALEIVPHYYEARFNLAIAYYNLNKPFEALQEINQVKSIGETYDNAVAAILKKNAEVFAASIHSKPESEKLNTLINDAPSLVILNNIAIKNNVPFTKILSDSCSIKK